MKVPRSKGEITDVYAASMLFILIAIAQIVMAFGFDLSPWKGGGFGMFSSIDSPGMRFIHVVAHDESNQAIRVDVNNSLQEKVILSLKTKPSEKGLKLIAKELIEEKFVPINIEWEVGFEDILSKNSETETEIGSYFQVLKKENVFYRKQKNSDPIISNKKVKQIKSVTLQIYRLNYDVDKNYIFCSPMTNLIRLDKSAH